MKLYLFDDAVARAWAPFSLTRPAGELMLGAYTFRERVERLTGVSCAGHITSAHLRGFAEPGAAPVAAVEDIGTAEPRLFLSARAVPAWSTLLRADGNAVLRIGEHVVGRVVAAGAPNPDAAWFEEPHAEGGGGDVAIEGRVIERVWDLVSANPAQIAADFEYARERDEAAPDTERAGQFQAIGYRRDLLRLSAGVTIEPNVVLDFTDGPIWLDEGVTVRAFTRLAGPAYIGRGSTLLGGPYVAVSTGPVCKVHGELEESVVLGYSNKAHDGFIGHAYLGRWVNLGALTTNSDLKNNYGTIRMWTPDGETDTGLIKLGCLLGDHVKTGIGGLLNTGTVIGAGSNLYGTEMPPKYVPPFSWGSGSELVAFDVERFVGVARTVMGRRELELDDGMEQVLRAAWRIGREGVD